MPDSLIEKYASHASDHASNEAREGAEDDLGCFGLLRGTKAALMLQLIKSDGHILGLGYAWLERVEFEPDRGITLHTPGRTVKITGSRLHRGRGANPQSLFEALVRHKVTWIREADRPVVMLASDASITVERIEWDG